MSAPYEPIRARPSHRGRNLLIVLGAAVVVIAIAVALGHRQANARTVRVVCLSA